MEGYNFCISKDNITSNLREKIWHYKTEKEKRWVIKRSEDLLQMGKKNVQHLTGKETKHTVNRQFPWEKIQTILKKGGGNKQPH